MGNYINIGTATKRDLQTLKFFKKIKTEDLFITFTDYYENGAYPRTELK